MTFRKPLAYAIAACLALAAISASANSAAATNTSNTANPAPGLQCLAPAKPGGGMDLTCKIIQKGLHAKAANDKQQDAPVRISYMPGGVGAVAWNAITTQRNAEAQTLVVFSGGSLMNLAQGKYGRAEVSDVRWVAAIGADYGMIAVRSDSPYKSLRDLMQALRDHPSEVTIGASGTVGSQDWIKMSLLATQSRIDPKTLRFVALEGGGEAFTALRAGHVQVVSGDASEAKLHALDGNTRILAVLSDQRLPGALANVPTAREQGIDVSWPIIRGIYMGPQVSDADYKRWVAAFDQMMASAEFPRLRAEGGLYPFSMSGKTLTDYVKKTVDQYGQQARTLGLVR
ncbi:tripartite tricarboxylate transporter substrate binding protein [Glaciimonas sp. PCH181]|uniref:Bug family tripartite tricarboxylate transporter substrate binding protein n=1 Tax=Glaciimonas sp. PCH181 TaxID=2133943 RepID=UPI000D3913D1|nr:tricarboxylate transporter [Glaciimonas sp. PCH181]